MGGSDSTIRAARRARPAAAVLALALACALLAWQDRPALSQPVNVTEASDCTLEPGPVRTAARVIDGETLVLDDGTEVRLVGALAPRASDGAAAAGAWPPEELARAALDRLVVGRTVEVGFNGRRSDRHGRVLGQVFVHGDREPRWVQGTMLEDGFARAYSLPDNVGCMDALLAHERKARFAGTGLWAVQAYGVRAAERTTELLRLRSTFQIVEGRITAATENRGRVLLNFDADYRNDFTIGLRAPLTRRLQGAGLDTKALEGRLIRVRGWIESRGGPFMELHHVHQIEVLPEAAALVSPSRRAARRRVARPSNVE